MRDIVFFCDNDLGHKSFPQALRDQDLHVETLIGSFGRYDEKDKDWLPVVGKKGWVVLTADHRMRYRARERDAIMEHNVRMFILRAHQHSERIRNFLDALPKIEHFLRSHSEGFMAKVYNGGRVEMWLQRREWLRTVGLISGDERED